MHLKIGAGGFRGSLRNVHMPTPGAYLLKTTSTVALTGSGLKAASSSGAGELFLQIG